MASSLQRSGMLSKEQLLYLFNRFDFLASQPDVKKRIADAVEDKQEAVAITTTIQEEIFLEMGVDPGFGIACLGKLNTTYENDKDLMVGFYKFLAKEEMACDEAALGRDGFEKKMKMQGELHEQVILRGILRKPIETHCVNFGMCLVQQLEMLKYMRKFPLDNQSVILQKLQQQLEKADFDTAASIVSVEEMEASGRRRVSPVFGTNTL